MRRLSQPPPVKAYDIVLASLDSGADMFAVIWSSKPHSPREVPTLDGWEISPYFQPAREVGGDFYDRPSKLTQFCVLALAVKRDLRHT